MQSFDVLAEDLSADMVDAQGKPQPQLAYQVFHLLESPQPAMDESLSGWTGDYSGGIPHLILKESGFDARPIFICLPLYVPLMRADLKEAIQRAGLTGFEFCRPEHYSTGRHGLALGFDER